MALRLMSTIGNDNRVDVAPTGAALGEHSNRRNTILPAMLLKVRARSRAMVAKRCACLDAAHRYEWAIDHRASGMMLNDYYKGGPPDRILARPPAEIKRMGGHASQFGSLAPGACAVRAGRWVSQSQHCLLPGRVDRSCRYSPPSGEKGWPPSSRAAAIADHDHRIPNRDFGWGSSGHFAPGAEDLRRHP
jgi:hypothetical protein